MVALRLTTLALLLAASACAADLDDDPAGADASTDDQDLPDDLVPLARVPFGPFDTLSESGLYSNIATKKVRGTAIAFQPEFKLWSDRSAKRRWIWIPPGLTIDTSNMGRWIIPVGTTAWKEFRDPDTGKRLETRIIQRLKNNACGTPPCFYYASFLWNATDSEAYADTTRVGQPAVDIPDGCAVCASPPCDEYPDDCHVVPQATSATGTNGGECRRCHEGEPYRLLGFSAVQLSHDGPGNTLEDLAAQGLLSNPPPAGVDYRVPGTPVERRAIGALHANCGHCHYSGAGQQNCYGLTGFQTRVRPGDDTVEETLVWQTGVGRDLTYWVDDVEGNHTDPLITRRIVPGDFQSSAVWYRMSVREWGQPAPYNDHQQMPTVWTNEVDVEGLGAVELWIDSL
ncbi:MAG TPA: hypothetical protein VIG06_08850 [Kofleriaceae bacterium]